jgi:hypothetical protein
VPIADVQSFKGAFQGRVLEPEDAGYDDAPSIDKRPKLIARCSALADVIDA